MQNHSVMPITAVILYAVFMVVGRSAMKNRQAWSWRNILAFWNLSLSVFSWIGMFRTAPQLIYNLTTMSLRDNMCLDPQMTYGSGSSGLWVQLFILSKFPERSDVLCDCDVSVSLSLFKLTTPNCDVTFDANMS
eukprot:scaffold13087_cov41-Attheya_sp.AAC.2